MSVSERDLTYTSEYNKNTHVVCCIEVLISTTFFLIINAGIVQKLINLFTNNGNTWEVSKSGTYVF